MDANESDYSQPPQWVLDLYDAEKLPPHVLVTAGETEDSYIIQDIDFSGINLFTVPITFELNLPVKGEPREFKGTPEEFYAEMSKGEAKVIFQSREIHKRFRGITSVPMGFGHSSDFSAPALVASSYEAFRKDEEAYLANPDNAGLAYHFINNHPLFWYRRESRRNNGDYTIVTERGWHRLDFMVSNKVDKKTGALKTTVMIECGPGSYHDLNLDVYAPSFDEAIVQLAKLIHTHYDSQGGFTDKTKKEPNDNLFRQWDKEEAEAAEKQAEAEEQQTTLEGLPITKNVVDDLEEDD